jgi:hypothetical protein
MSNVLIIPTPIMLYLCFRGPGAFECTDEEWDEIIEGLYDLGLISNHTSSYAYYTRKGQLVNLQIREVLRALDSGLDEVSQ